MTKPKRYKRYSGEFKREAMLRASEDHAVQKNFPGVATPLNFDGVGFQRFRTLSQINS